MAKDPIKTLEKLEKDLVPRVVKCVNDTMKKVLNKLQRQHLTGGTTDTSLAKRTGTLGRGMKPEAAQAEATMVIARLWATTRYAKTHFGPRGSEFPITPKKAKMLAIPLPAAKTAAGVARGGPMDGIWGPTRVFRSKAGNLIIWGYRMGKAPMGTRQKQVTGGAGRAVSLGYARKAMAKGELTPLFVLKSSVVIRRRIDPMVDLIQWAKPQFLAALKKEGLKVGGTL